MRCLRGLISYVLFVIVSVIPVAAFAQGYTATNVTNRWITTPTNATSLNLGSHQVVGVTLPFSFPYFGGSYTTAYVGDEGFMQISPTVRNTSSSTSAFPVNYDGTIAVAWYYHMHAGGGNQVVTHLTGTSPYRVFTVAWENVGTPAINAQIQLHETTGRIVFAYRSGGSWSSANPYYMGIQGVGSDRRFVVPDGNNAGKSTQPANDYQMDPVITTYTGRLLMDKLVSNQNGIGPSVLTARPVGGAQLELLTGSPPVIVGRGVTSSDGTFSIAGLALNAADSGTLRVSAQGASAVLSTNPSASPGTLALPGTVSFAAGADLGTIQLTDTTDPNATMRGQLNVLSAIQQVYEFALARTSDPIPQLAVYLDNGSSFATQYFPKTATTIANLRVGGNGSSNPDQWDDDVIARMYACHVFEAITGGTIPAYDHAYSNITGGVNALANGFGWAVRAAIKGSSVLVDGTTATTGTALDLESAQPLTARGPTVTGWVALALHDLADGQNESHDQIDGTSRDPGALVTAVDALTPAALTPQALFAAFVAQGGYGPGAARDFIYHGLLPDDAKEANDSLGELAFAGSIPFVERNLVLNIANEDWYRITVPAQVAAGLNVDVVFDALVYDTRVVMQVFNAAGGLVGDGTPARVGEPVRLVTGPLGAGDYTVRVAHDGGGVLSAYTLQAYERLEIYGVNTPPWTIGIPYLHPLLVRGGIPPYKLVAPQALALPKGLVLNDIFVRIGGSPNTVGDYTFTILVLDNADPPNQVGRIYTMRVNDHLSFALEKFTPLAFGKSATYEFERVGGTDPLTVDVTSAVALPAGVTMSSTALEVTGTPTGTGSAPVEIDATDAAGDHVTGSTTVVVCKAYPGPNAPAELAAGDAASGWFIDGVKGSTLTAAVKAGKKQAKRVMDIALVDVRGKAVAGGSIPGVKAGKAGFKNLVFPETGRYFVIVSSATGDAAGITATFKFAPPKAQSGGIEEFSGTQTFEVPFGVLKGATYAFTGKTDKAAGNGVGVQLLVAPDGRLFTAAQLTITEKPGILSVTGTCDMTGTWKFLFRPKSGPGGSFDYTMKLTQPKDVVYSAD